MRTTGKPFSIDKKQVYEAYKAVKSNAGSAGVDRQTIEQFEAELQNNLYKLWNRMSSGSYFPPPVRAVSIPKKSGGQRLAEIRREKRIKYEKKSKLVQLNIAQASTLVAEVTQVALSFIYDPEAATAEYCEHTSHSII